MAAYPEEEGDFQLRVMYPIPRLRTPPHSQAHVHPWHAPFPVKPNLACPSIAVIMRGNLRTGTCRQGIDIESYAPLSVHPRTSSITR
jgi:hypothetical protein